MKAAESRARFRALHRGGDLFVMPNPWDVGSARLRRAEAARAYDEPLVLTGRAENHNRGVTDLDDTIARLIAYRDAGAEVV
jgi:2-methylisocitrate lyase-like PEP mutase family enzyme